MKQKWSKFEILTTCLSIAIIPMAAVGLSLVGTSTAIPSLAALFVMPLICTAVLVRFLKRGGKRVWPASTVLAVLLVLFGLASKFHTEFTKLINLVTGHYNLEAAFFYALFMVLMCGGALVGTGVGALLSTKTNSKTAATIKRVQNQ